MLLAWAVAPAQGRCRAYLQWCSCTHTHIASSPASDSRVHVAVLPQSRAQWLCVHGPDFEGNLLGVLELGGGQPFYACTFNRSLATPLPTFE